MGVVAGEAASGFGQTRNCLGNEKNSLVASFFSKEPGRRAVQAAKRKPRIRPKEEQIVA